MIPIWVMILFLAINLAVMLARMYMDKDPKFVGSLVARLWLLASYTVFWAQTTNAETRSSWVRFGILLILIDESLRWLVPHVIERIPKLKEAICRLLRLSS